MGRSAKYDKDAILDAALDLIAREGPAAATVAAIAARLGAPTGSIYHRFASRDLIVAELWIRGIRRFQTGFVQALRAGDIEAAALHGVRWCRAHPIEAAVLLMHRREDLARRWPTALGAALTTLNDDAATAYRALLKQHPDLDPHRVGFAVFDLPAGAVRRHIAELQPPPPWVDDLVRTAVRAVLETPLPR
ncbi:TetR/AcrR family transcriptional regulator [Nocardia aurea]|uniref:TetR/AcrR family transcriptional regulator n=1 Tax=Nocardia aurea TaxID=2144174 RepID=UPI0033B61673